MSQPKMPPDNHDKRDPDPLECLQLAGIVMVIVFGTVAAFCC